MGWFHSVMKELGNSLGSFIIVIIIDLLEADVLISLPWLIFTCSKSTMETPGQCLESVQS